MKKLKKKYERPLRPWDKQRIESEKILLNKYGLMKKREIWTAQGNLRKFRRLARNLAAKKDQEKERILIDKLVSLGMLDSGATLDDVLSLNVEKLLERRLQTIVHVRGMANTPKQARQMIIHGHILIGDRKVSFPSYMVRRDEEDKIRPTMITEKGVRLGQEAKTAEQ
jgi:small subunit ribosomal protein S4